MPYTIYAPTNHFLFNILAFGGGVWGGAALKGKGNGGGMHARGIERVPRRNQTPMRTLPVRITTRSARPALVGLCLEMGSSKG